MLAILLLLLPSVHRSQSTLNNVQRQSTQSEALLRRGSSYISLTSSLRLEPGSLLGFSFRTCAGGGQRWAVGWFGNAFVTSARGRHSLAVQDRGSRAAARGRERESTARFHAHMLMQTPAQSVTHVINNGITIISNTGIITGIITDIRTGINTILNTCSNS